MQLVVRLRHYIEPHSGCKRQQPVSHGWEVHVVCVHASLPQSFGCPQAAASCALVMPCDAAAAASSTPSKSISDRRAINHKCHHEFSLFRWRRRPQRGREVDRSQASWCSATRARAWAHQAWRSDRRRACSLAAETDKIAAAPKSAAATSPAPGSGPTSRGRSRPSGARSSPS